MGVHGSGGRAVRIGSSILRTVSQSVLGQDTVAQIVPEGITTSVCVCVWVSVYVFNGYCMMNKCHLIATTVRMCVRMGERESVT